MKGRAKERGVDIQEKLKIRHKGVEYEGLPAANAVGMALFEATGMRRLIDERCGFDREKRILSPGMVVKALIGPTFNVQKKHPLYLVGTAYSAAPTDRLFGPRVEKTDLYDTALARGLDTLFDADLTSLFRECSDLAVRRLGLESDIYHMDSTNISFHGIPHDADKEGAAVPRHGGHAKDLRNELLQYELQIVTNGERVIRYMKPYDGNVSDTVKNSETLDDLGRMMPEEEIRDMIMVADSKLVTSKNIAKMLDMKMGFVSKCPESFGRKARKRAASMAADSRMHGCGREGLLLAETHLDIDLGSGRTERLRFVSYRWEPKTVRAEEAIRREVSERIDGIVKGFKGRRFGSRTEAEAAVAASADADGLFSFDSEVVHYSADHPEDVRPWYEARPVPRIDDAAVRRKAEISETSVLVTNLPRSRKTDAQVLELYSQEYKVEQSFRLMKSGIGVDSIFLQTPSRENAMMFVVSIAVLISNIADAMFRRDGTCLNGRRLTMYRLAFELQNTIVVYSRDEGALDLQGPREITDVFFDITDTLGINPQYLLGYA